MYITCLYLPVKIPLIITLSMVIDLPYSVWGIYQKKEIFGHNCVLCD
jgi:hypothetical protein